MAISGRAEHERGKDRADLEAGEESAEWGEAWSIKGRERIHQIVDFAPAPKPTQPVLSHTFPIHPLHHTVALDSGSEPRYV